MKADLVHWPTFWAGTLLHLTLSVVLLSFTVVLGPAMAWILGTGTASFLIAGFSVVGRAAVGFLNARTLWEHQASLRLCLRTVLGAALLGYTAFFGILGVLGVSADGEFAGNGQFALPLVLNSALALAGTAAGAMIAAAPPRRRGRRRPLRPRRHREGWASK